MNEAKTVAIVGAGPVGLAAAAHVLERGLTPIVLNFTLNNPTAPAGATAAASPVPSTMPNTGDPDVLPVAVVSRSSVNSSDAPT